MPDINASLKTAIGEYPVPQYVNKAGNAFEVWRGIGGAGLVLPSGAKGFAVGAVAVGASAVELKIGVSALTNRRKILLFCVGDDAVYLGPDNAVTVDTGYPLLPGKEMGIIFDPLETVSVYAIAASAQSVRVMEIN